MKKIIRTIHLWLGLATGLVIIIVSVTGCLYAFKDEIENITQPYRFVSAQKKHFLPPSDIGVFSEKYLPGKKPHSVEYGSETDAAKITIYSEDYYYMIYVNPYTGELLKTKDMSYDFFRVVLMGHYYLWLPAEIGQPIVATCTLIFVIMIISGIILWWPKNKSAAKQRFSIKWSAKWRRKNYDLHNVLGFYMCWIGIFIAVTGLVWGFQWFAQFVYWTSSGGESFTEWSETFSDTTRITTSDKARSSVDQIWAKYINKKNDQDILEIHYPETEKTAIAISTNSDVSTHWKTDYRYYDQYTLEEIPVKHIYGRYDNNLILADKILRMNYDIHVGAIIGLPGKFLAFFCSLICASLPITGFIIWRGRKKTPKKKKEFVPAV